MYNDELRIKDRLERCQGTVLTSLGITPVAMLGKKSLGISLRLY